MILSHRYLRFAVLHRPWESLTLVGIAFLEDYNIELFVFAVTFTEIRNAQPTVQETLKYCYSIKFYFCSVLYFTFNASTNALKFISLPHTSQL